MVLDSASGAFLDGMRAAGGKPLYETPVEEVRAIIRMTSQQLAPPAAAVGHVEDRRVPVTGGDIGVRIYTPLSIDMRAPLPVVVTFHGGGFVGGDLDTHDAISRHYSANAEAIVIAVDYRLAPEHRFPTQVDDAFAAVEWAAAHASELRGDAGRIAVAGDSAGGNLAAVVCQLAKQRGAPRIAYQVLVYPVVDFDMSNMSPSRATFGGGDYFLSIKDMEWFASLYFNDVQRDAQDPRASPILTRDLSGLPPALIVTAGCDLLRDEGKAYADRLSAAGVSVEYHCVEGTIHACMSFGGAIPAGRDGLSFVTNRLRAALWT